MTILRRLLNLLRPAPRICPVCQEVNERSAALCDECGYALSPGVPMLLGGRDVAFFRSAIADAEEHERAMLQLHRPTE